MNHNCTTVEVMNVMSDAVFLSKYMNLLFRKVMKTSESGVSKEQKRFWGTKGMHKFTKGMHKFFSVSLESILHRVRSTVFMYMGKDIG